MTVLFGREHSVVSVVPQTDDQITVIFYNILPYSKEVLIDFMLHLQWTVLENFIMYFM
jgi:hypothetical protein